MSLFVGRVVPSGFNVFQMPAVHGIGHLAEVLDEETVYVTRVEERTEIRKVFGELDVGDYRCGVLGDGDATGEKHLNEVLQALS